MGEDWEKTNSAWSTTKDIASTTQGAVGYTWRALTKTKTPGESSSNMLVILDKLSQTPAINKISDAYKKIKEEDRRNVGFVIILPTPDATPSLKKLLGHTNDTYREWIYNNDKRVLELFPKALVTAEVRLNRKKHYTKTVSATGIDQQISKE